MVHTQEFLIRAAVKKAENGDPWTESESVAVYNSLPEIVDTAKFHESIMRTIRDKDLSVEAIKHLVGRVLGEDE